MHDRRVKHTSQDSIIPYLPKEHSSGAIQVLLSRLDAESLIILLSTRNSTTNVPVLLRSDDFYYGTT